MMEDNYSIDEILLAVNEIKNKKKEKNLEVKEFQPIRNNSSIPINTLKLIEEAEKIKN
ncbi:hypothetical protein OAM70_01610 [Pelagibacteraceae bacterium]|nr:hypothetical protein [Pelagibacteraceae bacterium]MDC0366602.1 hypothetical protein [Pelagibacteraceae bacterium]|tara:strand:- start:165 stop:338 length:174 start_codon:yes stop_codon:yes gene_type:complete